MAVDNTTSSKVIETFKKYLEESDVISEKISKKMKETIEKDTINRDEVIDVVKEAESDEATEG